jgi:hypothetical protein
MTEELPEGAGSFVESG